MGHSQAEVDQTCRNRGLGSRFVPHFDAAHGVLDHDFIDSREGSWAVQVSIVPIGPLASVYTITFKKPEGMPVEAFTWGITLMENELQKLREVLESD